MATRSQNVLSLSHLSVLLLGVALVLLNAVASRVSVRADWTEDGVWTLSEGTRQVLRGLQDPASVKVFWKDVPKSGESEADRRYLASLLEEMRAEGRGRLTVRWIDLTSEDGQKEADSLQVEAYPIQDRVGDEIRTANSYQTVLIEHGAKEPERIEPLVTRRREYEYEVASALHRLTRGDPPVVGIVAPQPAFNPFAGRASGGRFNAVGQVLRHQLGPAARPGLSLDEPVAEDVKILLVVAPESLAAKQVWHLEQFALRGGKVVLLLDPVNELMLQHGGGTPDASGLEDWLAHLGVTVERAVAGDFARDGQLNYPRPVRTRIGTIMEFYPYPYWPLATASRLNQAVPATRGLGAVPFYWPSPLVVDREKAAAAGRTVTVLASTSGYGAKQAELSALERPEQPRPEDYATLELGVLIEGAATSFWKGKPSPPEEEKKKEDAQKKEEEAKKAEEAAAAAGSPDTGTSPAEGPQDPEPPAPGEAAPAEEGEPAKDGEPAKEGEPAGDGKAGAEPEKPAGPARLDEGKITLVVLGDAELVADTPPLRLIQQGVPQGVGYESGFAFANNLVDWLSGSEALLELRARGEKPRKLEDLEAGTEKLLALANVAVVPLLIAFAGLVVFLARKYGR